MSYTTTIPQPQVGRPTIEVTGNAVRQQVPKSGVIFVTLSEKAPTQEGAWSKFQGSHAALIEAIGTAGTLGNVMPTESSQEVSRGLRSGVEFVVTATIEVAFSPSSYAQIIEAFLKCGLPVSLPRFTYDELPKVTPELLGEAAASARANAVGIANGVEGKIGRLVAINIGPPRRKPVFRSTREIDVTWKAMLPMYSQFNTQLMEEKLETFDTEIQVTVEFEIIQDAYPEAVA